MATPAQGSEATLQLRRTFAAPRPKVFAAWTERQALEEWMCRDVATQRAKYVQLEVRTGGHYVMEVTDTATDERYTGRGTYREVAAPEKLVFTWAWTKRQPDGSEVSLHPETQVTVEFHERGNSTEVVLTHEFFRTTKDRQEHEQGWRGCFDALARSLEES